MHPGDVDDEIHGDAAALSMMRTRRPSTSAEAAGEATRSFSVRPDATSTTRVPLAFTISDGRIVQIDVIADPERLQRLDLGILDD
jgi:hypothetical protein